MDAATDMVLRYAPKRYLAYAETDSLRIFYDAALPLCAEANYAVLKSLTDEDAAFRTVEQYLGSAPCIVFSGMPDGVPLGLSGAVFERHGYTLLPYRDFYIKLETEPQGKLHLPHCKVRCIEEPTQDAERALVRLAHDDNGYGVKLTDKQLAAGAKAFFAYNSAGVPISYCLAEGYGAALWIREMYTPLLCRGQGCASVVLRTLLRFARDEGYADVFLYSADAAVRRVCERQGFRAHLHESYWACRGAIPPQLAALTREVK